MNYKKVRNPLLTKAVAGDINAIVELNSAELSLYQQAVRANAGTNFDLIAKSKKAANETLL